MMHQALIEIEGLGKTFKVATRKKTTKVDANTFSSLFHILRESFGRGTTESEPGSVHVVRALSEVDLRVFPGEVVGIIGRNGAGKSTLLKVLARVVDPSEGRVRISGRVVSLLELGLGFDPQMSVRENIYLYGQLVGMTRKEVTSAEETILNFAELNSYVDEPLARCPGGSYIRLAFATMMGIPADIVLADEVLAVGDAKFRETCEDRIRNVAATGEAVLFVSHDMEAIRRCCTRVAWIEQGEIRKVGETNAIVDEYMADLLGPGHSPETNGSSPLSENGRIVDLRLASTPGNPVGAFQLDSGGVVEALVRLDAPGLSARVTLDLFQGKSHVFKIRSPWTARQSEAGVHSIALNVPAHFLNELKYEIRARLDMTPDGQEIVEASSQCAPLPVMVMNTNNSRSVWADWTWSRPGVISPKLSWTRS